MTDQTPATAPNTTPQEVFARRVTAYATEFLTAIAPPEKVAQSAGRIGLALRKAAIKEPRLYGCDPRSVANCIAMSALTGLMPGGPKPTVHLIPRKSKNVLMLEWQISARGLQALAEQVGGWLITATPVHVDDVYEVELGTNANIRHVPSGRGCVKREHLKAIYVVGKRAGMADVIVPVPLDLIWHRAQPTDAWRDWPVEQAQKTAVVYAISRGHFGALEASPEFSAIGDYQDTHREQAPVRTSARPVAMEYTADADDLGEILEAE